MKQYIFPAIKLTLISIVFLTGGYTLLIWGIAQLTSSKGRGEAVSFNHKTVGFQLEGQLFTMDKYFNGRPSACQYNAAASSGTNKGPSNPDYLKDVAVKIDSFKAHNPGVTQAEIPSELVTASGSGLDPDISPEAAKIQIPRIAKIRQIPIEKVESLVKTYTRRPMLGIMGTSRINVLALNIALDQIQ